MRKTASTLFALVLLSVAFAWPIMGSEGVESQDSAVTTTSQNISAAPTNNVEPPEMLACDEEAAASVLEDILISVDTLFPTSTSWNCNGCIQPSPCGSHAECGFPQGVCVQNSCICICDPYVG